MVKKAKKTKDLSDSDLVKIIIKKNPESYREIVRRYQRKLFVYLYHLTGSKEETEDILQNVFVKVYNNLKKFNTQKKFSSWIYRIAHNEAVNYLKKRSQKRFVSWEDVMMSKEKMEISSHERSPLDHWIKKELKKEMEAALDKLPSKYKEVLILRYFTEKSYEEMSEILKRPVNTVGTLINRAKKKLMDVIESSWK
jgi:RNA polymerase sigma-70 factor (ECF subfamily)